MAKRRRNLAAAMPRRDLRKKAKHVSTKHAGRDPVTGQNLDYEPTPASTKEVLALAERGATVDEIAVIVNVRPGLIRQHHGAAVDRILALRTLEVEEALLLSAKGKFTHPDTHVAVTSDKMGRVTVTKVPLTKHFPPNINATQFWLKNRQPAHRPPGAWEDHSEGDNVPPDERAAAIRARLKAMREAGG